MDVRSTDRWWAALVASGIGATAWLALIASAPRHSYGEELDMGNGAYYPLLLLAAAIGGGVWPRHAGVVGPGLVLPALVLAPWNAPRGDGDGLWILIFPYLVVFAAILTAVAVGAGLLTRAVGRARRGCPR